MILNQPGVAIWISIIWVFLLLWKFLFSYPRNNIDHSFGFLAYLYIARDWHHMFIHRISGADPCYMIVFHSTFWQDELRISVRNAFALPKILVIDMILSAHYSFATWCFLWDFILTRLFQAACRFNTCSKPCICIPSLPWCLYGTRRSWILLNMGIVIKGISDWICHHLHDWFDWKGIEKIYGLCRSLQKNSSVARRLVIECMHNILLMTPWDFDW